MHLPLPHLVMFEPLRSHLTNDGEGGEETFSPPHVSLFLQVKCKNIFNKMLKDVGIEVPKSIETRSVKVQHACRQRQGMIACNNHNMHNPF